MAKSLEEKNKAAPRLNPTKSGIRTGNPQLDPESARKHAPDPARQGDKPHGPPADPESPEQVQPRKN
jgi:hypothetical protein